MTQAQRDAVHLHGLIQGLNQLLNDAQPLTGPSANAIYALAEVIEERADDLIAKIDAAAKPKAA